MLSRGMGTASDRNDRLRLRRKSCWSVVSVEKIGGVDVGRESRWTGKGLVIVMDHA